MKIYFIPFQVKKKHVIVMTKRLMITVKHLNIGVTRKFLLMQIKKRVFRHEKTPKSHTNIKMYSKTNFLSKLVYKKKNY